uniref:FKBP prolyl isomerase 15 n=1 Tax=Rousettus aegyptiacus TaxID=9407 RepID=A0A7J8IJH0_ROUAE|nr:FKBP prolyl isomerase 15 [Rousettus aegyptiacus]
MEMNSSSTQPQSSLRKAREQQQQEIRQHQEQHPPQQALPQYWLQQQSMHINTQTVNM